MAQSVRRAFKQGRWQAGRGATLLALLLPLSLLPSANAEQEVVFDTERCAEEVAAEASGEPADDAVVVLPLQEPTEVETEVAENDHEGDVDDHEGDDDDHEGDVDDHEGDVEDHEGDDDVVDDEDAVPTEWVETRGRQCHRYLGRRVCEGPRRIPQPHGEAAERGEALGLGTRRAAGILLRQGPPQHWLDVIDLEAEERLCWPVDDGRLWRHFGYVRRRRGRRRRLHKGIDVGGRPGSLIRAVRSGLVTYSNNGIQGYGNTILIVHSDATVALYAHNQANYVFPGQLVRQGRAIGEVGATGLAHGAHLHLELRRNGRAFNPIDLFDDRPRRDSR